MPVRLDKLGRRIPEFDRSAAAKKAQRKNKENYGTDFHKRSGAVGGHAGKRGYFGALKDAGKTDELHDITSKGGKTGVKHFKRLAEENPEELRKISSHPRKSPTKLRGDEK